METGCSIRELLWGTTLAFVPLNSYERDQGGTLPKYVIDKSCSVPKLGMQKSTICAETVNRAFQRTGPRLTGMKFA